ncbi:MAG: hypothetical protein JXB06_08485 [Spirochaetales bacterium]|nr:hypothetical protein [Spirochaetales bacterium]
MKRTGAALLLFAAAVALDCQSVLIGEELRPFRINEAVVTDLQGMREARVRISGRSLYGEEIELFESGRFDDSGPLRCYFYLDDSIRGVSITVSSPDLEPVSFEYDVSFNPYSVALWSAPGLELPPLPGYRPVSAPGQLGPGDILVLDQSSSLQAAGRRASEILDRGIHIVADASLLESSPLSPEQQLDPWRGLLLSLDPLDTAGLRELLETQRRMFAGTKKRYHDLIASADFYGIPVRRSASLVFENARARDIAASLERDYLPGRTMRAPGLRLLAFYLPALVLLAFVRKTGVLLPLLCLLLCLFVVLSFLSPAADQSLLLALNPSQLSSGTVRLLRSRAAEHESAASPGILPVPGVDEQHFVPRDYDPSGWSLLYGVHRSTGREIPLAGFSDAAAVRFNQIPEIERRGEGYALVYVNPLRYWSLHEPD